MTTWQNKLRRKRFREALRKRWNRFVNNCRREFREWIKEETPKWLLKWCLALAAVLFVALTVGGISVTLFFKDVYRVHDFKSPLVERRCQDCGRVFETELIGSEGRCPTCRERALRKTPPLPAWAKSSYSGPRKSTGTAFDELYRRSLEKTVAKTPAEANKN